MIRRIQFGCLIVAILVVTSGCVTHQSATHIKKFTTATTELADQAIATYDLVNQSMIDRRIAEISVMSDEELETAGKETFYIKNLYSGDPSSAFYKSSQCIQALIALKDYAKALGDLAGADYATDIDKNATKLYGSLTSLNRSYEDITGESLGLGEWEFGVIATLIDGIGNIIVENKRREAIKGIVIEADPFVSKACDAINAHIGDNFDYVQINLDTVFSEAIDGYKIEVLEGRLIDSEKKVKRIERIVAIGHTYQKAETIPENIKTAVEKVRKAHTTLRKTVEKDLFTSKELVRDIGELAEFTNELKAFYKGLLNN